MGRNGGNAVQSGIAVSGTASVCGPAGRNVRGHRDGENSLQTSKKMESFI